MEHDKDTVTISLKRYEEMVEEIKTLREITQQKTIVKYYIHPIYGYVIITILLVVYTWWLFWSI